MSELEIFQFPATGQQIRAIVINGEPWFIGSDVADALGFSRARDAVRMVEDEDRAAHPVRTPGGMQQAIVINESGLYTLILRSNRPEAKAFKRWVTNDVLPQIRMTGRYEPVPQLPQTYAQALRELASKVEENEGLSRALAVAEPKAEAWQVLASAEGDYAVREAASVLNRDPAIDTGQNRLFRLLREWKIIDGRNRPYASHSKHVRLRATHFFNEATGEEEVSTQVRITIEGLHYLHKRMGGVKQLQIIFPSEAA